MNKQTKAPAKAAVSKAPINANFKFERAAAAMESASGSPRPRADRRASHPSMRSDAVVLSGATDLEAPRADQAFDFEDEGHRLQGFAALVGWIERARALTDNLQAAARNNPKLHDLLSSHGLAYGDAYWDDDESNGLRRLMTEMWTAAGAIRKIDRP